MPHKIEVVPYDPHWPNLFEEEARRIKQVLGENCLAIYHVGSTAVPGLCAKPKIDIIAVVKDTALIIQPLEKLGYNYKGEYNIPFHRGFSKRGNIPKVNLHVYEEGNPEIKLNLVFRDFLQSKPEIRDAYAALKLSLIQQKSSHEREMGRFRGYNLGKDGFIKHVLDQAGFDSLCMRFCTHYDEWKAARHFRQTCFFDKISIEDPFTWTFNHKEHVHFVLYKGPKIIGYAHIQLWQDQRAAMRIIVIDEHLRNQGLGAQFLSLCERWLKQQGFKALHIQSSPEAYNFYCKHGYSEMPFHDPEGHESHPRDIDIGKVL